MDYNNTRRVKAVVFRRSVFSLGPSIPPKGCPYYEVEVDFRLARSKRAKI